MKNYKIGKIVNAVALRGEVKVYNYSDKDRYDEIENVIIDGKEYKVEKVRYQQKMVILKLEGVDNRNDAEALKTKDIYITEGDLRELPEDTFYIKDLVGMDVVNQYNGKKVGTVKDVLQNSAQDIYQVQLLSGKESLIPAVKEFVKNVDVETGIVTITPIPGMIDDEGLSDED